MQTSHVTSSKNSQLRPELAVFAYEDRNIEKPMEYGYGLYDRKKMEEEIFPSLIEDQKGKYFSPSLWGKCFKKEVYQKGQLTNCRVDIGEDGACVKATIYNAKTIFIMQECLYYYRQCTTSVTKSGKVFDWTSPKRIGLHLEKSINIKEFDFQNQIYRNITHNLFNVVLSQFNSNKRYELIKKNICENISDEYYQQAIKKSEYKKNSKGMLAKYALCKRWIWLIYVYHKIVRKR